MRRTAVVPTLLPDPAGSTRTPAPAEQHASGSIGHRPDPELSERLERWLETRRPGWPDRRLTPVDTARDRSATAIDARTHRRARRALTVAAVSPLLVSTAFVLAAPIAAHADPGGPGGPGGPAGGPGGPVGGPGGPNVPGGPTSSPGDPNVPGDPAGTPGGPVTSADGPEGRSHAPVPSVVPVNGPSVPSAQASGASQPTPSPPPTPPSPDASLPPSPTPPVPTPPAPTRDHAVLQGEGWNDLARNALPPTATDEQIRAKGDRTRAANGGAAHPAPGQTVRVVPSTAEDPRVVDRPAEGTITPEGRVGAPPRLREVQPHERLTDIARQNLSPGASDAQVNAEVDRLRTTNPGLRDNGDLISPGEVIELAPAGPTTPVPGSDAPAGAAGALTDRPPQPTPPRGAVEIGGSVYTPRGGGGGAYGIVVDQNGKIDVPHSYTTGTIGVGGGASGAVDVRSRPRNTGIGLGVEIAGGLPDVVRAIAGPAAANSLPAPLRALSIRAGGEVGWTAGGSWTDAGGFYYKAPGRLSASSGGSPRVGGSGQHETVCTSGGCRTTTIDRAQVGGGGGGQVYLRGTITNEDLVKIGRSLGPIAPGFGLLGGRRR